MTLYMFFKSYLCLIFEYYQLAIKLIEIRMLNGTIYFIRLKQMEFSLKHLIIICLGWSSVFIFSLVQFYINRKIKFKKLNYIL